MPTRRVWMSLLLGCAVSHPVAAQTPPPAPTPAADQQAGESRSKALFILKRHIRAVGGEDVIRAIEHITIRGSVEIAGAQFVGSVYSRRAEPPRQVTHLELGPLGTIHQGYDGSVAWTVNPGSGPVLLEGAEAVSMIRSSNIRGDLQYEQTYVTIEFIGDEVFEGENVFAIRLVDHDGVETTEYYSKSTGARLGVRGTRETASGVFPYTRVFKNYAEHERFLVPMTTIERIGQQVITVKLNSVSFERVDPDEFVAPESVQALIDAAPEGDASP